MNTVPPPLPANSAESLQTGSTWKKKLLITSCVLLGISGISAASAAWWYQHNFNASSFTPVQLSLNENKAVDEKIAALEGQPASDPAKTIVLNEREINGYLERQGLGETVKVNIRHGNVAATVLAPMEEGVPLFGGQTLRLKVAFNTKLDDQKRFALSLSDVSIGGISLPNAWLGNVKGLNLLSQQGELREKDFLHGLAAGIKDFQMKEGEMRVVLND
jgi:hypothetical protein